VIGYFLDRDIGENQFRLFIVRNVEQFLYPLLSELLGELNASHTGASYIDRQRPEIAVEALNPEFTHSIHIEAPHR